MVFASKAAFLKGCLVPSRQQWKQWSLPSKLTAIGALFSVLSVGLYFLDIRAFATRWFPKTPQAILPGIVAKINNPGKTDISVFSRTDFVLWLPQGVSAGVATIPGMCELAPFDPKLLHDGLIEVKAGQATRVLVTILNREYFSNVLNRGDTELSIIFHKSNGGSFFSDEIPFEANYLKKYYVNANASQ